MEMKKGKVFLSYAIKNKEKVMPDEKFYYSNDVWVFANIIQRMELHLIDTK